MYGLWRMNESMGVVMLEYNKYTAKCEAEGKEPVSMLKFMTQSIAGTLEY